LKHPQVDYRDVPLFDSTKAGGKIRQAERQDEPGAEKPTEGSISDSTVPKPKGRLSLLALESADFLNGDWSWKPGRDKRLGKNFVTFRGVPPSAAELYGPRILT
jgi:hypothetical protein